MKRVPAVDDLQKFSKKTSNKVARRKRAAECFGNVAESLGPLGPGVSVFAVTRGQWSMIDAILYCLDQLGPSEISVWTWTVADYEVQVLARLRQDKRVLAGRLCIDHGARVKNHAVIQAWKAVYGADSVRYLLNHSKLATVTGGGLKLLLRGSMNLNHNPRFEQFDLTEGGEDYALVRGIEETLPVLGDDCSGAEVFAASQVGAAWTPDQLEIFGDLKTWQK